MAMTIYINPSDADKKTYLEERTGMTLTISKVDFIDSSGLGMLVSLFKLMNGKGDMALCSLNPGIMNMFTLTRMDRIFRIYPDKNSALAQLGQ